MIEYCSICRGPARTVFKLDFRDLPGADEGLYTQHVGLCPNCGYLFTQNPFSDEQLKRRYADLSKFEFDSEDYILDSRFAERSLRQLHFLQENADFGQIDSVLEVGAASGYNLSLYKEICSRVRGIEPSGKNCRLAMQHYQVDLFNGMFDEYYASEEREVFDLLFLSMVLEHIVDPARFIQKCASLCNRYMFIEVPILDLRHDEEPMGIFAEEHVSLFTVDSLCALMRRAGFELVNMETVFGIGRYLPAAYPAIDTLWVKSEGGQKPQRFNIFSTEELFGKYIAASEAGLDRVRHIIDAIPNDMKLALWGVGHHAAMLLANTSLGQKNIVRVYDSDARKHHLAFAGQKLTSFAPEDVESGAVEGILLTTYTAQRAIQAYLARTGIRCRVYTLYDI